MFETVCGTALIIIYIIGTIVRLGEIDWESANKPQLTPKERRIQALHNHVAKTGARDVFVKRVGAAGNYLEHFMLHYYDAENSWQVRHVIRRQIPRAGQESFDERYYWDDPVVSYEREVSAEISQAKQQLINDLDLEIHKLQTAIAAAKAN